MLIPVKENSLLYQCIKGLCGTGAGYFMWYGWKLCIWWSRAGEEKDVIIEEIRMYQDTPDDLVMELNLNDAVKGNLGKPIIGTEESVKFWAFGYIKVLWWGMLQKIT